jgi:hypothetical protein
VQEREALTACSSHSTVQGTCTGEHGIGRGKLPYLLSEHGEAPLQVLWGIGPCLKPHLCTGPGNLVPPCGRIKTAVYRERHGDGKPVLPRTHLRWP